MNYLMISIVYASFFSLIGISVYFTDSAMTLLALLLAHAFKSRTDKDN